MSEVAERTQDLDNWINAHLEQLAVDPKTIAYGVLKPGNYDSDGAPLIRIKDLKNDRIESEGLHYITKKLHEEFKRTWLEGGEVLVSIQGTIGRVAIVPERLKGANISRTLAVIRPAKPEFAKWILYFLKSPQAISQMRGAVTGSTRDSWNLRDLRQLNVPLAPLEQQKRIVAKIEELFSHIDTGIEALKKAKQLLKQYRQSVLKAAVTGELLGKLFPSEMYKSINHGLESIGQGWSPKCAREPSPSEDVWGVIKTTAVQSLEYLQEENKRLPDNLEPRPQLEVVSGDILVTRAGPRVRVGVCCLVKETRKKLMICDKVYRLRPDPETILPEYLEIVLNAPQVQKEIERLKTGISDSGVNLTQKRFVELKIPYLSIDDQKRLISLVYEKTESIARLENELETQSIKAEKNKQSVLASAFSGNLARESV